jgi:hypothetical protein
VAADKADLQDEKAEVDELLARLGGWVLLVVGCTLSALAFVFRKDADVAPTALVLGVLCIVLAVVLSRVEGPFKFGTRGIEGELRAIRRRVRNDPALPRPPQKADVVEVAREMIEQDPDLLEDSNGSSYIGLSLYTRARSKVLSFEDQVYQWLVEQGWDVSDQFGVDQLPDFIAERDGEQLYAETKVTTRPLDRAAVQRWIDLLLPWRASPNTRVALFVSAPSVTASAASAARRQQQVEIYVETGLGNDFWRLDLADAPSSSPD